MFGLDGWTIFSLAFPLLFWLGWLVRNDSAQYDNLAPDGSPLQASVNEIVTTVIYFFYGFILTMGQSMLAAGIAFTLGGFVIGMALRKVDLSEHVAQLAAMVLLTGLLGIATVAIFTSPFSVLTLIGATFAFAFGQLLGMFARTGINRLRS